LSVVTVGTVVDYAFVLDEEMEIVRDIIWIKRKIIA